MAGLALSLILVSLCSFDCAVCFKELYLREVNADVAHGRFVSSAGRGISFHSTNSSLSILDLSGNEVLLIQTLQYQQWIRILGNTFVQLYVGKGQGYRDYYVPKNMYEETSVKETQFNASVLELLGALSYSYHTDNLRRSVLELTESPFVDYVENVAYTLGVNLELFGDRYPSLLSLYLVANMLEQLQVTNIFSQPALKRAEEDCFKECPPCPDEECLSLCGYGCHCWKWVCGDCCYHLGCHGHDICCRKNFIQTKCLFPISFKCETEYSC